MGDYDNAADLGASNRRRGLLVGVIVVLALLVGGMGGYLLRAAGDSPPTGRRAHPAEVSRESRRGPEA